MEYSVLIKKTAERAIKDCSSFSEIDIYAQEVYEREYLNFYKTYQGFIDDLDREIKRQLDMKREQS